MMSKRRSNRRKIKVEPMFLMPFENGNPPTSKALFSAVSLLLSKVKIWFIMISLGKMSSYEKPRIKLLMIFAGPWIGTAIKERMVSEVREPKILQRKEIKPLNKMLTAKFDAKNTYFVVCISPPFFCNLPKSWSGSI